jgi:hypothetical protein
MPIDKDKAWRVYPHMEEDVKRAETLEALLNYVWNHQPGVKEECMRLVKEKMLDICLYGEHTDGR